ncbi:hypothetical protein Kpol_1040p9 [Vanderwaltozyma polyspora DSM 70294]|uniref:Uncharacterized protein n=1 Tax=Vanderwaltozyma polyspora (strain ATCC 22028 / DSM 70294 / BCRC 21397 / CBS 2163 / NBRC 10782 / NRRL Y-8283 / UCD 57-17) TaxID=436907 RepID=A7TPK4_VANPO|nr:uncharacterized protein Kpol_1040p9 [Vanderwaltozyma polyspora DSM 70294]EDO15796.1 hypothetical protein Kpol_1040p9 [Vanderwaltozyma polyspora DSM 70294]
MHGGPSSSTFKFSNVSEHDNGISLIKKPNASFMGHTSKTIPIITVSDGDEDCDAETIVLRTQSELSLKNLNNIKNYEIPTKINSSPNMKLPKTLHSSNEKELDLTSSSSGTFSDFMFHNEKSKTPLEHTNSSGSSNSIISSNEDKDKSKNLNAEHSPFTNDNVINSEEHLVLKPNYRGKSSRSMSHAVNHDRKRLVDQFLDSVNCSGGLERTRTNDEFNTINLSRITTSTSNNRVNNKEIRLQKSFENFFYNDLIRSSRHKSSGSLNSPDHLSHGEKYREHSEELRLPHERTNSNQHDDIEDVSDLSKESSNQPEETNTTQDDKLTSGVELAMFCNELYYSQSHIQKQLIKYETILRNTFKDLLVKEECNFKEDLESFDSLLDDLNETKSKIIGIKEVVSGNYLKFLETKFDKENDESFISKLTQSVSESVEQLDSLEERLDTCREIVTDQKKRLSKMENILEVKKSLKQSKQKSKINHKYSYIALDVAAAILLLIGAFAIMDLI